MKRILRWFYYAIIKLKLKACKGCIFGESSDFSMKVQFEGRNVLSKNSVIADSHLGYASYLGEGANLKRCHIGKYTSIGPYVYTIIGKHPTEFVSTHPVFFSKRMQVGFSYVNEQRFVEYEEAKYDGYSIKIGNDVWIGAKAIIRDGVNIGDGAIIGAGALVLKDVPPYAVVGGVPAKVIRYRFEKDEIDFLLKLKWWDKSKDWLQKHAGDFDDIGKLKKNIEEEM